LEEAWEAVDARLAGRGGLNRLITGGVLGFKLLLLLCHSEEFGPVGRLLLGTASSSILGLIFEAVKDPALRSSEEASFFSEI